MLKKLNILELKLYMVLVIKMRYGTDMNLAQQINISKNRYFSGGINRGKLKLYAQNNSIMCYSRRYATTYSEEVFSYFLMLTRNFFTT